VPSLQDGAPLVSEESRTPAGRATVRRGETGRDTVQDDKTQATDVPDRRNAQSDHHGKGHRPEEFDTMNPQKQSPEKTSEKD
jgi:hypothetical protein